MAHLPDSRREPAKVSPTAEGGVVVGPTLAAPAMTTDNTSPRGDRYAGPYGVINS